MIENLKSNAGYVSKGVGYAGKGAGLSGDALGAYLTFTGKLPVYFLNAVHKGIEALKYTLTNNPGVIEPLHQSVLNNLSDIAILTWIALSAIWTGYKILK